MLSATCAAVAEFNSGVEVTIRRLCGTMGIASGESDSSDRPRRPTGKESGNRSGRLKHRRRLHDGSADSLGRPRLTLQPVTMPLEDSRANPEQFKFK